MHANNQFVTTVILCPQSQENEEPSRFVPPTCKAYQEKSSPGLHQAFFSWTTVFKLSLARVRIFVR